MNEFESETNQQDIENSQLVAIADGNGTGLEDTEGPYEAASKGLIAGLSLRNKRGVFTLRQNHFELQEGQGLILKTNRGSEFATVKYLGLNKEVDRGKELKIFEILRIADENDWAAEERNRAQEAHSQSIGMARVRELKLKMKIVRTEQLFDGSRIIFYFIAPQKVDFRELVRLLASEFRTRIELRQINSREHVAMMGAVGACGRQTCCSSFLTKTPSVSMDMVETQGLGKNPSKLNGVCGRLKCCISYENDFYHEALEGVPVKSSCVGCSSGKKGRVVGVNAVKEEVQIRLEDESILKVAFEDIRHKTEIDDGPKPPEPELNAEPEEKPKSSRRRRNRRSKNKKQSNQNPDSSGESKDQ